MHGRPNQRSRGAEFECTHLLENICTVVGSQFGMAEARLKHWVAHSLGEGCCTAVIPLVMIIIRLPPFLFALICLLACAIAIIWQIETWHMQPPEAEEAGGCEA